MVLASATSFVLSLALSQLAPVNCLHFDIKARKTIASTSKQPRTLSSRDDVYSQAKLLIHRPSAVDLDATDEDDGQGHSVVENVHNLRWTTDITISGQEYTFLLDTGSRDLWLDMSRSTPVFEDTGIPYSLRYGDKTYGVDGSIGIADFTLGTQVVDDQAFLAATKNTIRQTAELGVDGLLGLQFDLSASSGIAREMKKTFGKKSTKGRTFLENIFRQNTSIPNFIAFDLGRADDLEDSEGGFFTIGEHSPKADPEDPEGIEKNSVKIEQYPKGGSSWTALVDKITVNGVAIPLKSMFKTTPKGKVVALLDTGAPKSVMSKNLRDSIYDLVEGSGQLENRKWHIPCLSTPNVVFTLGGQDFPMHPLDLSYLDEEEINGENRTRCIGSMRDSKPSRWEGKVYEMILGADFLMNVYAMFDFGDFNRDGSIGRPYMKLHSQVNVQEAAAQVATVRGTHLKELAPEDPPTPTGRLDKSELDLFPDLSFGGWLTGDGGILKKYAIAGLVLICVNALLGLVIAIGGVLLLRMRKKRTPKYSQVPAEVVFSAD